jgi:hypothetical protein
MLAIWSFDSAREIMKSGHRQNTMAGAALLCCDLLTRQRISVNRLSEHWKLRRQNRRSTVVLSNA